MAMEPGYHESCPRRIRAYRAGLCVVDTTNAEYFWEHEYFPAWFIRESDVVLDVLPSDVVRRDVRMPGHVCVVWSSVDQWFEEDEEVFVHPQDPYKRVDVRDSSRHVQIVIDGTVLADCHRPVLLFETSLPTRYYLPKLDVRFDLLVPTAKVTNCPYKGTAEYWSLEVNGKNYPDIVWGYRCPKPDLTKIAGHVCFYDEQVDVILDGVSLSRPITQFS